MAAQSSSRAASSSSSKAPGPPNASTQKVTPFLMFTTGKAEEAMNFYMSLFPKQSQLLLVQRFGEGEGNTAGLVKMGLFTLQGTQYMVMDSPPVHAFTFTPSISLWVNCDSVAEIDHLFKELSQDGKVMMPLDKYPFAERFGFCSDRYGVSWQLVLREVLPPAAGSVEAPATKRTRGGGGGGSSKKK